MANTVELGQRMAVELVRTAGVVVLSQPLEVVIGAQVVLVVFNAVALDQIAVVPVKEALIVVRFSRADVVRLADDAVATADEFQ